jgi:hypothetical protein
VLTCIILNQIQITILKDDLEEEEEEEEEIITMTMRKK